MEKIFNMILEDETFNAFGYYPSALTPKSAKRILAACNECGKIRECRKHNYHTLCRSCSAKGKRCCDKNPMFGIH